MATKTLVATRRARAFTLAGGALLTAAFLAQSVPAAILGASAIVYLLGTWMLARSAFREVQVHASRTIDGLLYQASPAKVYVDTTGSLVPAGVELTVTDVVPRDFKAAPPEMTLQRTAYEAVPLRKGQHTFEFLDVHLLDRRGLWKHSYRHILQTSVQVLPSKESVRKGRSLARRSQSEFTAKSRAGFTAKDLEFESLRDYQPGDRLRDVDWKRVSQLKGMLTKEWEKESHGRIALLIDVGRSMRARSGDIAKLDHAVEIGLQLAELGRQRGYGTGYVAFAGDRTLDSLPPHKDVRRLKELPKRLASLPPSFASKRILDAAPPIHVAGDQAFLTTLDAMHPEYETVEQVVKPWTKGQGRLFVFLISDLEHTDDSVVTLMRRFAAAQHKLSVLVLPATEFMAAPDDARIRDLENAYKAHDTRRDVRRLLQTPEMRFLELDRRSTLLDATKADKPGSARIRRSSR